VRYQLRHAGDVQPETLRDAQRNDIRLADGEPVAGCTSSDVMVALTEPWSPAATSCGGCSHEVEAAGSQPRRLAAGGWIEG
jgi:hypothetical protein